MICTRCKKEFNWGKGCRKGEGGRYLDKECKIKLPCFCNCKECTAFLNQLYDVRGDRYHYDKKGKRRYD